MTGVRARTRRGSAPGRERGRGAHRGDWAVALASGAAAAVIGYAALRMVERVFFPEPNPAIVIWSDRSSFVWRAVFSLYFGGFGAFGGLALARRPSGAALGWLPPLLGAAALLLTLQATLFP